MGSARKEVGIMAILDPQTFVYGSAFIFFGYAAQMLLMPGNMVTDHFDAPATPLLKFWIRGSSISIFAMIWACLNLEVALAAQIMLFTSASIGVLYPWNAKFNYLTDEKLPV